MMSSGTFGMPPDELAIRFAAFADGVSSALAGTRRLENLHRILDAVDKGLFPSKSSPTCAAASR